LERLANQIAKMDEPKEKFDSSDDRFWSPKLDKAGNGYAVIRFLPGPAVDGDGAPDLVQYFSHGFQGPTGKWYIENSLTTFERKDPVGELNRRLWSTNDKVYQDIARKQKRKLSYISNILVVKDPENPANEGKVFLYRYGKKLFEKIKLSMFPVIPDKPAVNPFDFYEGADFRLVIRNVAGYNNYDQSEFASPSRVKESEPEMKKIWESEYSLSEFVSDSKFKSYTDLKNKLDEVIGCDSESDDVFEILLRPTSSPKSKEKPVSNKKIVREEEDSPPWEEDSTQTIIDDGDEAEFFKKIADSD
jgi:hypothetical protein